MSTRRWEDVRRELVTTPEEETAVQAAADQLRSEVDAVDGARPGEPLPDYGDADPDPRFRYRRHAGEHAAGDADWCGDPRCGGD